MIHLFILKSVIVLRMVKLTVRKIEDGKNGKASRL